MINNIILLFVLFVGIVASRLSLSTDWRQGIKLLYTRSIFILAGATFNFATSFMGNTEAKLEDL